MSPQTTWGKVFGTMCAVLSILILALPVSIIGTMHFKDWAFPEKKTVPPIEDIYFLSHRPPGYQQIFSDPLLDIRYFLLNSPGYSLIFLYRAHTPWISADIFNHL